MEITDQLLNAYIDGELDERDREEIKRRIDEDEALHIRVNELRSINETLAKAYPLENNIPERFLAAVENASSVSSDVLPFRNKQTKEKSSTRQWFPAAIAASITLVIGAVIGNSVTMQGKQQGEESLLTSSIDSSSALYEVLEKVPSASSREIVLSDNSTISLRPVLSFKNVNGGYCREFDIHSDQNIIIGIACRKSDSAWGLELAVSSAVIPQNPNSFQPASGYDQDAINVVIDNLMVNGPIEKDEEHMLIGHAWK